MRLCVYVCVQNDGAKLKHQQTMHAFSDLEEEADNAELMAETMDSQEDSIDQYLFSPEPSDEEDDLQDAFAKAVEEEDQKEE